MLNDLHVAYALLFAAVLFLVEGLYFLVGDWMGGGKKAVNRRMRLIASGGGREAILSRLRRDAVDGFSQGVARALPFLARLLRESGLAMPLGRLFLLCLAAAGAAGMALKIFTPAPAPVIGLATLAAGLVLPSLALRSLRARRLRRMGEQMPEALDMMVRALKAGHPITSALGLVAQEMPDPAGTEFGVVVDEMTYGLDLNSALRNLTERMPHPDLQFFRVSVQIQHKTGGNLGEVLGNLATVIRDRISMGAKVKAITSQSRSAALVIGALPVGTTLVVQWLNPDYFGKVADDPLFLPGMMIAGGMMLVGQFIIYRLVQLKF